MPTDENKFAARYKGGGMTAVSSGSKFKKELICGGHESWLNGFKKHIRGVVLERGGGPHSMEILKSADEIWVQPNAISHAFYRKILYVSRKRKIPLHYFAYSSHVECVRQFMSESGKV